MIDLNTSPRIHRAGFTLVEMLVAIALIMLLTAIQFPVFARARENARRASCQSNLKHLGHGFAQYIQDFDEKYPPLYTFSNSSTPTLYWFQLMQPYVKSVQILRCPSQPVGADCLLLQGFVGYGMNIEVDSNTSTGAVAPTRAPVLTYPAELLLVSDNSGVKPTPASWPTCGCYSSFYGPHTHRADWGTNFRSPTERHIDGANALFADGHVKRLKRETVINTTISPITDWRLWFPQAP